MKQLFFINNQNDTEVGEADLFMRVGEKHFCFAIVDGKNNQLKQLAYYIAPEITSDLLSKAFSDHSITNNNFEKTLVVFDLPFNSLVPIEYYKEEKKSQLLNAVFPINSSYTILADKIEEFQVYNVYAVSNEIYKWVNEFRNLSILNQFSISLKQVESYSADQLIFADIRTDDFTVTVFTANKLLLAQTFPYQTPEDVLYYLLKICQQFDLSQQQVKLLLSGLVDQNSALYKDIYQYFIDIDFRNAKWDSLNNEYPAHFFTSLNDLAICVS